MNDALNHGGRLQYIAKKYGRPVSQWIDLSTGIAPTSYPIPCIDPSVYRRLPEVNDDFLQAAAHYYGSSELLPIAGSQSVIQRLPELLRQGGVVPGRVWLPEVGYKEHEKAWRDSAVTLAFYQTLPAVDTLCPGDVVIIINPNNPTGFIASSGQLQRLQQKLQQLGGMLIVDEAFMDCTPHHSLLSHSLPEHVMILRSAGKFFGLAGIRVGFLFANAVWRDRANSLLGPWQVNGPAIYILQAALEDEAWQQHQIKRLCSLSSSLHTLLLRYFNVKSTGTTLFRTVSLPHANSLFEALCEQGLYVRLTDENDALRFGLPTEEALPRVEQAIVSGLSLMNVNEYPE